MTEEAPIKFYFSSTSANANTVAQQNKIEQILTAKKVKFEMIDIASSEEAKAEMRRIMGNETGLAPQICNGEQYCGDYERLYEANEIGELFDFLKLPSPPSAES